MDIARQVMVLSLALFAPVLLAQTANSTAIQQEAWQIVQLANQARAQAGAGPLKWDPALALAARQHCLRMAAKGQLSHQFAGEPEAGERAAQAGAHFSLIEENVALGPTPAAIHNEWMHSPHHRANLLNSQVDRIGVAVVAGRNGLYAVADYARAVPLLTQTQIESQVAGLLHGVAILPDTTLARTACANKALPGSISGPRPRFFTLWEDVQLTQLPQTLADKLATGQYHQAAVGSSSMQGEAGEFTAYRIAVLLY
jgi:uncharacterized protein YkwD